MTKTKSPQKILFLIPIAIFLILVILAILFLFRQHVGKQSQPEVITISTLEKIIDVEELSTFSAIYNGIAKVPKKDDQEEIAYYVAYEAEIKAGIDFKKIRFDIDSETKNITLSLPNVRIISADVAISSLDYMFIDKKANTSTVSQEAYKACELDVKEESAQEQAICKLAQQNAENIMRALINPFLEQAGSEYILEISWGGQ